MPLSISVSTFSYSLTITSKLCFLQFLLFQLSLLQWSSISFQVSFQWGMTGSIFKEVWGMFILCLHLYCFHPIPTSTHNFAYCLLSQSCPWRLKIPLSFLSTTIPHTCFWRQKYFLLWFWFLQEICSNSSVSLLILRKRTFGGKKRV